MKSVKLWQLDKKPTLLFLLLGQFLYSPINAQTNFLPFSLVAMVAAPGSGPSPFPASLLMDTGMHKCTVNKIDDKIFLTAAHCVANTSEQLDKNQFIFLKDLSKKPEWALKVSIRNVVLNTDYYQGASEAFDEFNGIRKGIDLALIEINEKTPEVPVAKLNFASLAMEQEVIPVGYGSNCDRTLEELIPKNQKCFEAGFEMRYAKRALLGLWGYYFYTPRDISGALTKGDSGGAVYLKNTQGEYEIVGINSFLYQQNILGVNQSVNGHVNLSHSKVKKWLMENWKVLKN